MDRLLIGSKREPVTAESFPLNSTTDGPKFAPTTADQTVGILGSEGSNLRIEETNEVFQDF
jgi:hypothetical protein